MSMVLVIAAREIRERSRIFLVAAVAALVPFVAAMAPAARGNRGQAIVTVAGFLWVSLACGLALALGSSTIGEDLTEKRLSFYFSKPISAAALWSGKAAGAFLMCLASMAVIAIPARLASPGGWVRMWNIGGTRVAALTALACVIFFLASHVLSTMVRSRSLLLAVDFALAVVTLGLIALLVRPLILGAAVGLIKLVGVGIGGGLLIALAVAPVWQLANGRTDARRSHVALSTFLWISVAVVLAGSAAIVAWAVSVEPADLTRILHLETAPDGRSAIVVGRCERRGNSAATFLIDTATGEHTRLISPPWGQVEWSHDGRVIAWMQPAVAFPVSRELELMTRRIGQGPSRATGIRVKDFATFALSQDGGRLAILADGRVTVHDLTRSRVLMAAALDGGMRRWSTRAYFVSPDVVRIIDVQRRGDVISPHDASVPMNIREVDVRRRTVTKTGTRLVPAAHSSIAVSSDGARLLVRSTGEVVDGRTAATILPAAGAATTGSAILFDGTVVTPVRSDREVRLRLIGPDGAPVGDVRLPGFASALVTAETSDGKLVVRASEGAGHSWKTMVVDWKRGVIDRTFERTSIPWPDLTSDPRHPRYDPAANLVGVDDAGTLVLLNLQSGATTRL